MNPLFQKLDELLASFKKSHPQLYRDAIPRRYVPPNGYLNPRFYGADLLSALANIKLGGPMNGQSAMDTMEIVALRLLRFGVPTYFVAEDFCRAVAATEIPPDLRFCDIHFPMEAMLFCLPINFMREYTAGTGVLATPFTAICHAPEGREQFTIEGRSYRTSCHNLHERVILHTPVFWGPMPTDYSHVRVMDRNIVESIQSQAFVTYTPKQDNGDYYSNTGKPPTEECELKLANLMNSLTVKLWMVLEAKPEFKEEGQLLRKASAKCHREKDELWGPNLIGRAYRIAREPGYHPEGTHLSPRMHWRRGHRRQQRYGHALSLSKAIWIEPVLINAETKERETA